MASNGSNFIVTPKITSLSPGSGPVGTAVTVSGSNFGASQGTSQVTVGGVGDTPNSWSANSLGGVIIPNLSAGPAGIQVFVGGLGSNAVAFQVTPAISSLSPTLGAVGASVTITGSTFGGTRGTSTVTFNGVAASPTSWSDTSIIVPVPSGATTGNVVVTVVGQASNGVPFTVTTPPANIALVQHKGIDAGTTTNSTLAFTSANTAGNFVAVVIRGGNSNAQVFTVRDSNSNTYKQANQLASSGRAVTSAIHYAEHVASHGRSGSIGSWHRLRLRNLKRFQQLGRNSRGLQGLGRRRWHRHSCVHYGHGGHAAKHDRQHGLRNSTASDGQGFLQQSC